MRSKGTTLIEIMTALLILAFAFIPIIGVIGSGAKTTDVSESYIFAKTTARNILDTVLDSLPFAALGVSSSPVSDTDNTNPESNVGLLSNVTTPAYNVASFLAMIGNTSGDNAARGQITDDRGFKYDVKLFVFPIPVSSVCDVDKELSFRYLPRPKFEEQNGWYSGPASSVYIPSGVSTPYDMALPTVKIKGARELGATGNSVMKKLLLRIKWKIKSGRERSIEIYTAKANLDEES